MMSDWQGIFSVSVTPFTADGAIDEPCFCSLLDATIEDGADGVVVAGGTGEFYALSPDERVRLFRIAVRHVAGRVPVIAGVSDLRVNDIIAAAHAAGEAGCSGAMVLPPIYAFASPRELVAFFQKIAAASPIPIMLYNSPRRIGVSIEVDTVRRLADIDGVVAIKDSSGLIVQIGDLVHAVGERIRIFVGYETMIAPALALGAHGVVAMAHQATGRLVRSYYNAIARGDRTAAEPLERDLFAVYRCFQSGSYYAAIKETMAQLGRNAGPPRPPLLPLAEGQRKAIADIIAQHDLTRWAKR
jgi:4-hydroxy-tetrahydrodipicolinate synthase